jgi:hypothetical protein
MGQGRVHMRITAAVLDASGWPRPYAASAPLRIAAMELAPPRAGEPLVDILAAGLCHSDLSVVNGDRPRPTPMVLGREAAANVLETGSHESAFAVGDQVVLTFPPACGPARLRRLRGVSVGTRLPVRAGRRRKWQGPASARRLSARGSRPGLPPPPRRLCLCQPRRDRRAVGGQDRCGHPTQHRRPDRLRGADSRYSRPAIPR